jgi:chromosome segregation ATPase
VAKAELARIELEAFRSGADEKIAAIRQDAEQRITEVQAAAQSREMDAERKLADIQKTLIEERSRADAAEAAQAIYKQQVADLQADMVRAEGKIEKAEGRIDKAFETYKMLTSTLKPPAATPAEAEDPLLKPPVPPAPRKRGAQQAIGQPKSF